MSKSKKVYKVYQNGQHKSDFNSEKKARNFVADMERSGARGYTLEVING